eukprot:623233_1
MCDVLALSLVVVIITLIQSSNSECTFNDAGSKFAECAFKHASQGNWLGTSACAVSLYNECQTLAKQGDKLQSKYDITINGNWDYLRQLGGNGWSVQLSEWLRSQCNGIDDASERAECFFEALKIDGCYVAWTGGFNKGKTTTLNRVCGTNFASGFHKDGETKGFNIILRRSKKDENEDQDDDEDDDDEEHSDIVHIDTPGATRCVAPQDLQDRFMTDQFVYDVLPDLADVVVLVVDILTSDEQVLIDKLMDNIISFSTAQRPKKLYIVHNFKTLTTKSDIKQYIETDIIDAFTTTSKPRRVKQKCDGHKKKQVAYYTSEYKNDYQITHFVFAADHTEAGGYYNPIATQWLSARTNDMECVRREINVLQHFINKLEPLLRDYFYSDTPEIIMPPPDLFAPLRRAAKWIGDTRGRVRGWFFDDATAATQYLQEYQLKLNVSDDPFKLVFKPVMGIEGDDGVIILDKQRELIYCPADNVGDTPQCVPAIPCVSWRKPTMWGLQCKLADAEFIDTVSDFKKEVTKNIFVLRPESGCELIIYGTILTPWRDYVNEKGVNTFELSPIDGVMHGFVQKRFTLDTLICIRYNEHHKISYKNGILTVTVKLSDKDEL